MADEKEIAFPAGKCNRSQDVNFEPLPNNYELVIIKQPKGYNFICMTVAELEYIFSAGYAYMDDLQENYYSEPKEIYYKLFMTMQYVDNTLKKLYDQKVNTMQLVPKYEKGLHGIENKQMLYSVKKLDRCVIYGKPNCGESSSWLDPEIKEKKTYRLGGQLWTHEFYKRGKLHGERKTYYDTIGPDGELLLDEHSYYKNGKLHGKRTLWWDRGELAREEFYVNGKLDGIQKEYDIDGRLFSTKTFRNGEEIEEI